RCCFYRCTAKVVRPQRPKIEREGNGNRAWKHHPLSAMAACVSSEQRPKSSRSTGREYNNGEVGVGSPSPSSCLDELVQGTGRWENMQEVLRSAIKGLLDTQAQHQQQITAQQKHMRDLQASFSGPRRLASDKARREEVARATAAAVEIGAGLFKLRADVAATREDVRAEANDLLLRIESKASRDHVRAGLDEKASRGELADLQGCLDRMSKGAGVVEAGEVQALHERIVMVENRLTAMETRVQGCEAHAVRADPAAVALRIETLSSRLEGLSKRVDHKASASATERALDLKADKVPTTRLRRGAANGRMRQISVETGRNSAGSALISPEWRRHARQPSNTLGSSKNTQLRADGHDQALARLEAAAAADRAARSKSTAEGAERGGGGRDRRSCCARGLRGVGRRLDRVEGALAAVATASAGAVARAAKTADAVERHRKRRE
ncbi:unnamed protein product, partial [Scytosiphon promiscuus]